MSEWRTLRLDEVADRVAIKNTAGIQRVMTVSAEHGLVDQERYFTKRIASTDLGSYWVIEPGDFVYNKSTSKGAPWGVVARYDGDESAVVTSLYIVFRAREDIAESAFLELACNSAPFFESLRGMLREGARAHGLLNVRLNDFFHALVSVPSVTEQRRIVKIMSTVDAHVQALRTEIGSARRLLRQLLAEAFEDANGAESPIVDLCSHVVGGIWGSPEGESEVEVLALGPRIYTPGTSGFVTDGSPTRSFTLKQVESRLVHENDIILERSGGSAEQPVGRVVIAGPGLSQCVPTDFQRLMRPDPVLVEPRYLFWRLQHDWNQGLTRNYSRRTTGITNLSVKDYIARVIPVPSRMEQVDLVQRADAVETAMRAAEEELSYLRAFRSTLLAALLSQEIEISESYDAVLEAVS